MTARAAPVGAGASPELTWSRHLSSQHLGDLARDPADGPRVNRAVGRPKTIEYHLRSVYRKLSIGSRSELKAAMTGLGSGQVRDGDAGQLLW